MTIPLSKFFYTKKRTGEPVLNDQASSITRVENDQRILGFDNYYRTLWEYFKQSPELNAITGTIATDVIGQRPEFFGVNGEILGSTNYKKAINTWRKLKLKSNSKEMLIDGLMTGDGYLWKGKPDKKQVIDAIKQVLDSYSHLEIKEQNKLAIELINTKEMKATRKIKPVASSTMQILTDDHDIVGYRQSTGGNETDFDIDEILHYKYISVNGESNGWSPVKSLLRELVLLYFVKGNMEAYMRNGGSPDKLFVLETEKPGSIGYKKFIQGLQEFQPMLNRHGKYVGTGKINVIDLNTASVDLEFKELSLYCTSVMAFAFGIPVTRIPFLLGNSATGGDSGGLAESGYWNHIEEIQDQLEDLLNDELLSEFGFSIKLSRKYKQDKIRDAQANSMNADTVTKLQQIYLKLGKKIKLDKINYLLLDSSSINICSEDLEDVAEDDMFSTENNSSGMNRNLMNNNEVMKEPDNRKKANTKRDTVNKEETKISSV